MPGGTGAHAYPPTPRSDGDFILFGGLKTLKQAAGDLPGTLLGKLLGKHPDSGKKIYAPMGHCPEQFKDVGKYVGRHPTSGKKIYAVSGNECGADGKVQAGYRYLGRYLGRHPTSGKKIYGVGCIRCRRCCTYPCTLFALINSHPLGSCPFWDGRVLPLPFRGSTLLPESCFWGGVDGVSSTYLNLDGTWYQIYVALFGLQWRLKIQWRGPLFTSPFYGNFEKATFDPSHPFHAGPFTLTNTTFLPSPPFVTPCGSTSDLKIDIEIVESP